MKFKTLFLSMLTAAAIVGCNNESVIPPSEGEGESGEPTYATFILKTAGGETYAGSDTIGTTTENAVNNAVLAIYKSGGTPEAIAYVNAAPQSSKVTLKSSVGTKKIFLAVNVGAPVSSAPTGTSSTILVYGNTNKTVENTASNPGVTETYEGVSGTVFADTLNALLVATGPSSSTSSTYMNDFKNTALTATGTYPVATAIADGLIKGLTSGGAVTGGILTGDGGTGYLMSNWDGPADGTTVATCTFELKKASAGISRPATPDNTNASGNNAFTINVQRAIAKIGLNVATLTAGTGSNAGTITLANSPKFAVGNISKAVYPFQQFDGNIVKSPAYNCTEAIGGATNQYRRFMDNSRVYPSTDSTTASVISHIANGTSNAGIKTTTTGAISWAASDYTIVTENNNQAAYNVYSTYVIFPATYKPSRIITAAGAGDTDATCADTTGAQVTYTAGGALDTLWYVKDDGYTLLAEGKFFLGGAALVGYMQHVLGIPLSDIQSKLTAWNTATNSTQAKLQAYYKGQCFYRINVKDDTAVEDANKFLVRRNHIYNINVTKFNGPGIGNPGSIVTPNPALPPGELGEADTYVTATINVLPWHRVNQNATGEL